MPDLVYGDGRVDQWVAQNLAIRPFDLSYSIANVDISKGILGATVFHGWYPETGIIEMSAFGEHASWMSRKMINAAFSYAFDELKCQMIVWRVSENNSRMANIAERLGFVGYTIPRLRGRHEADIVFTLTDDKWNASKFRSH